MLGFVSETHRGAAEPGQVDRLMAGAAEALRAAGWALAGVVQVNEPAAPDRPCHMDLHLLQDQRVIRISQELGALSQGCRLNTAGLEQAVGLVEQALQTRPNLLMINKFGKQEADGRGFRPLIGQAMVMEIPVLTGVSAENTAAFLTFAEDIAEAISPDIPSILRWFDRQTKERI